MGTKDKHFSEKKLRKKNGKMRNVRMSRNN